MIVRHVTMVMVATGAMLGGFGCAYGVTDRTWSMSDPLTETDCGDSCSTSSSSSSTTTSTATATTTTTTTSTTTTTTTTGGSACDNRGSCDACANCAVTDSCAGTWDSCMANADCSSFMDCLSSCADDTCANDCATQYPAGMDLYMQIMQCAMCDACPVDCQAEGEGLCY